VAVADLGEEELAAAAAPEARQIGEPGERHGAEYPALYRPERAGARPGHALEEASAIDPVAAVVVLDDVAHDAPCPFRSWESAISGTRSDAAAGIFPDGYRLRE
jgi:hypothetical protein